MIRFFESYNFQQSGVNMNQSKKQEIRACTFEMQVTQGTGSIKFPCQCYVQWKTSNGKDATKSPNRVKLIQGKLAFNEKLILTTHLAYDLVHHTYAKKESVIILNLLSQSRPNEPKLVGRVTIELGAVANGTHFPELKQHPLQFCSVDATLTFKVALKEYTQTNLALSDLERSQYSELEPALSQKITTKEDKQTKSESGSKGVSLTNIGQSVTAKISKQNNLLKPTESSFQERMNRLKSENQHLYNAKIPEGFASRLKREKEGKQFQQTSSNLGMSRQQASKQFDRYQSKGLNNDFSVPILTKNSDEFDSNQVSEKTIPNPRKSEKSVAFLDSPQKSSSKSIKESNGSNYDNFHSIRNQESSKIVESISQIKIQQEIISLKSQISTLKTQNDKLSSQLQNKNKEIKDLTSESQQYRKSIEELRQQINSKDIQLQKASQENIHLLQQQTRVIQQKDRQIQTLISSTFQAQKQFGFKESQFQKSILQLQERLKQLEQQSLQKPVSPPKPTKSLQSPEIDKISNQIEDLSYRLELEKKNHENAKIELNELQQWYKELQQQSEKLSVQNQQLKSNLKNEAEDKERLKGMIEQLNTQKERGSTTKSLLQQKQNHIGVLTEELNNALTQINSLKTAHQQTANNEERLKNQLNATKKQLDELQQKYVEQESNLQSAKVKVKQFSVILQQNQRQVHTKSSTAQRKTEQLEELEKKMQDLIKRLKEKQQALLKALRESEQLESKLKLSQSNLQKIKQRAKILQAEKNIDQQKIKSLEKEIRLLRNKSERDQDQLNKEICKLKQNLQNENTKKRELSNLLIEAQSKSKSTQIIKVKQLEKKINKHLEKQVLLKEQLILLQQQSNKISETLSEKQQNQQKFGQAIIILRQQNGSLKVKISQLQNQCELLNERNQGLQAEIDLLNAYQPSSDTQNNEIAELNKKLIEKNKDLLHQIEEKNLLIAEMEKEEGQLKGKEVVQLLSTSRLQKEKQQYQHRYQEIVDENQKLYREFEKLNIKYRDQLTQSNNANEQKIQSLQSKTEELYIKLTEKDVKYAQLQIKTKEDVEKLQQSIHEKDYQLSYYSNQIQALSQQIGQKEFQLHLAEEKIKQLFETITTLSNKQSEVPPPVIIQNNVALEQELNHYKSKFQFYEAQIERLHEKEFIQEKELITINQEMIKLKENNQEETKHIAYLEGELKQSRERQSQYIKQIQKFQASQNLFKGRFSRLQKDKSQLNTEIDRLTAQIQALKQKRTEKSQEGTPINKFKESPSPLKPAVDLSDVVGQINSILLRRKQQQQLQNALRLVIDNNTRQQEQFERWSRQRGLIQEKAKLASKELQKIKSSIMKTTGKSIAQKTQLTNLLKPAEAIVNELINISEHLIELDPYEEQEESFDNPNQKS